MKIYDPNILRQTQDIKGKDLKKGQDIDKGQSFLDILKAHSTSQADSARPSSPSKSISPTPDPLGDIHLTSAQEQSLSKGQEVLGLLNHLSELYNKAEKPTSSLESLASALDHNIRELKELKGQLDDADPLKRTIEEIEIISVVEKIKITRGDYT